MIARNQDVATDAPSVDPSPPTPPAQPRLTKDQIFHLLQNERRRLALIYLREADGQVEMRRVAEQVAAWEHDTTVETLDSDERQRVYIPLYQNHLPKLDEEGVIDYDQCRGSVERTDAADQLDPYLTPEATGGPAPAPADTATDRWPQYYLGTALLGALALAAAVADAPVVGEASTLAIALLAVVAVAALALVQVVSERAPATPR